MITYIYMTMSIHIDCVVSPPPDWPAEALPQQQLQLAAAGRQFAETAGSSQPTGCWEKLQLRLTAENIQMEMLPEETAAAHQELHKWKIKQQIKRHKQKHTELEINEQKMYLQCRLLRSRDCPEWPGWDTAVAANWVAQGGFFCPPNWAMIHLR